MALASDKAPGLTVTALSEVFVMLTTGVPVIVRFVMLFVNHTVPEPVITKVPVPKAIVLVFVLLLENKPQVIVLLFKFNVPAVSVTVLLDAIFNESCKAQLPPAPLNVQLFRNVTRFVVIVWAVVALKVNVPVLLNTVPAIVEKLPDIVGLPVPANVTLPAETVKLLQSGVYKVAKVTVYVAFASKITLSKAVGIDAPPEPPDEVDQFVVFDALHVPLPPTQ
jgi:hypothetical protein